MLMENRQSLMKSMKKEALFQAQWMKNVGEFVGSSGLGKERRGEWLGSDGNLDAVTDLFVWVCDKRVGALRREWEGDAWELCRHHQGL